VAEFVLALPDGYRRREPLAFYSRDPMSVSERVLDDGLQIQKCATISGSPALLEIRFEGDSAVCASDASDSAAARLAIVRMLGIHSDAAEFERAFAEDPLLGALIGRRRGLRIPLTPDPWEALAWAIMGQQISVKMAVTLRRNLIAATGEMHASGLRAHPSADIVAKLDVAGLRALKFSGSKADYLLGAARAVAEGKLPLDRLHEMPVDEAANLARAVRGIGPWTIQYFFLRGLGLPDCLPSGDAGLARGLERICGERPTESKIRETMARFSPWRSLATYHVWAGFTDQS
jgi:DNA-3-methyladenine glycosylase II